MLTSASSPAGDRAEGRFPDWRFAPNIGRHPAVYEIENRASLRAGHVLAAMSELCPWAGRTIVDVGCGTGFWLPVYADQAGQVLGVEPDRQLLTAAGQRIARLEAPPGRRLAPVDVLAGSAEHIPLADNSADVLHARFAYFFPPGTDAGLAEALRVLRPGGRLIVVDNDYRWGEFADLLAASAQHPPLRTADRVAAWWAGRGATRHEVRSELCFASRHDLEAVLHIEFPAKVASDWLRRHPTATGLSYGYTLFAVTA